ncbi:HNH endonuclease [Shewanella sp. GD04112]|uniref:HNH endonuclease n=1 Tax=Shewanella sp. GD04112 TaxID=2975434 RepID=UPI00244960FA|nr:HNH endonuclease [Shewanella sp. GD04112]MDH0447226.1 HNH endonuclease [Shewanella sp. GD04112]
MQFFWVNQSLFKQEQKLGVIRADTRDSEHHARRRIFDVRKGDVIFSFSKSGFQAVLIAEENADASNKNCTVACTYNTFESCIDLDSTIKLVQKHLQGLYSPIDSASRRNQGYLYPLNEKAAIILLELCGLEIEYQETETANPKRKEILVSRIIRNTKVSQGVKRTYKNTCQVCGVNLTTSNGPYSEGAHIIPLGKPYNGPDVESNILCLCPNHHVLLDGFAFSIAENGKLIGIEGNLQISKDHKLSKKSLAWHKMMYNKALKSDS